jgi:hypothetical protein
MEIPGTVISTLRLAESLIPERSSTSEKRRRIYDSVAGQQITFVPEVGREIRIRLRNSVFVAEENATYLTVSISDPDRQEGLTQVESDFRFHYLNLFLQHPRELGNPLIERLNFSEIGPEKYKIELKVDSTDPPTLQMAFGRVETVLSQTHSEYHQFLQQQADKHRNEFEITTSYREGEVQYEAETDLDKKQLIPQPDEGDFELHTVEGDLGPADRITVSRHAFEYTKWISKVEVGGDDYLEFI